MQVVAAAAMEAPAGGDPTTLKDAQVARLPRGRRRRPGALRARPVRRLPRHRRRRAGLDDRDLRGAAAGHRELALVGRAVLHPHRQAPAGHADRAPARLQAPAAARLRADRTQPPEPNQLVDQARPVDRRPVRCSTRTGPTPPAPSRSTLDMEFADEGGEGADAVRGAAPRRDGGRQHALHPAGRRRGDLADHAAAARRAAAGAPVRAGLLGARGRPTSSSPATAAGTSPWIDVMSATDAERRRPAAERGRAVAVPADRGLRVPLQLPHRRAGRRRRRDRLALRPGASTRRACSAACSTARRASSGSGRSASTIPPRAPTSRARTCWSPPGRRRPAGSWCATR